MVMDIFAPAFSVSMDQELSIDTLTLSLVAKLSSFFTYSNYDIDFWPKKGFRVSPTCSLDLEWVVDLGKSWSSTLLAQEGA